MRLFDVSDKSSFRRHLTERFCDRCGNELRDTIVHFGERVPEGSPHRWTEATTAAAKADLILCLGSSLQVGSL
jgi:NAD-dependent deacetylase sirtuin 7